jgi:hypothetical protein
VNDSATDRICHRLEDFLRCCHQRTWSLVNYPIIGAIIKCCGCCS